MVDPYDVEETLDNDVNEDMLEKIVNIGNGIRLTCQSSMLNETMGKYPLTEEGLEDEYTQYQERVEIEEFESEKKRVEDEKAAKDSMEQGGASSNKDAAINVDASEEVAKKPRTNKTSSDIWNLFHLIVHEGKRSGKCKWCGRIVPAVSSVNGTSALWAHANRCLKNPEYSEKQPKISFALKKDSTGKEVIVPTKWLFNNTAAKRAIAIMIVLDELAFSIVEKMGFWYMTKICFPPDFDCPSRRTITRECLSLYCEKKDELKKFFKEKKVRVSLTTDCWTSAQKTSYMSLTAHYIDKNWKLQDRVLCFVPVDSHKGDDLADVLEKCLREWGLLSVYCITVDNASPNDVMVRALKDCLRKWKTSVLDCQDLHMRCVAHISNLVVQDGLKLHHVSVERLRGACKFIRLSPNRIKQFKEEVGFECVWTKNICIDVPHRWNSTYKMLERAIPYEKGFVRYAKRDKAYKDAFGENPTEEDWRVVKKLKDFLKHFYVLTLKVSGTSYCTSNLFLGALCSIQLALREWKQSLDPQFVEIAKVMQEKFDKYWQDPLMMNKNIFFAVVLDPSQKMRFLEFALEKLYGEEMVPLHAAMVKSELMILFDWYKSELRIEENEIERTSKRAKVDESSSNGRRKGGGGASKAVPVPSEIDNIYAEFLEKEVDVVNEISELDLYLSTQVERRQVGKATYDVLAWWKLNEPRFPILAAMARDVLAVPMSTVASESLFSTCGRILDDFRSSLTPKMAQALVCAQDWFRSEIRSSDLFLNSKKVKAQTEDMEDEDELDSIEEAYVRELGRAALD